MLKISFHIARHTAYLLVRIVWLGLLLLVFSGIGTLLLSRYWLLPHIEDYHDQIAYAVGSAFGRPVSIGRIEADWYGFRPHLLMINVRFQDQQGATVLALEKVESEVAWTTLFTGQLRLYSLVLDQPDLSIKRDASGEIFVAGLGMSGAASGGKAADWLLNQSRIEVRDARVTWLDEVRNAPPLVFTDVSLRIDNGWRRHRFAFRALPPTELSAQVDVRGDFNGASFDDMSGWKGQLFGQLDYADVAAWRAWLPMPVPLRSGKGAVRCWMGVEQGKVSSVTADLALSGVRTRLAEDLPVLDLRNLHGRVGWRDVERGLEVSTRNLSLRLSNGFALSPTDFFLRYSLKQEQGQASGQVRANKLDLLGLSTLSEYLPFNRGFKRKLAAFDPRGKVTDLSADWDWQGDADQLLRFNLRARFSGMAMKRVGSIPGFSGLTGRVDGNDGGGDLAITSRKLTLDTPAEILPEKIQLDSLSAQIGWETGWRGLEIRFNNVTFANRDLEGTLNGTYRTVTGSPGAVDMTAHLTRAVVRNVDRYIPIPALGKDTHAWLTTGLVGGRSDDVSVRLSGDLAKFPFPDQKDGEFLIRASLKDAAVEFHKDWPRIENINGDLRIDGKRLEVNAPSAATLGSPLQKVSAVIPDLLSPKLSLQVYGEAPGDAGRALEYTRKSPVRGLLGGFTDNATATGKGELKLKLDIPLVGSEPVRVDGSYRLLGADVDLGPGIPLLQEASGDILFTESSVRTRDLAVKTLGGPAKLEVNSSDDGKVIKVKASGTSSMDALRTVSGQPVLRYLHGGSPWDLAITAQGGRTSIQFTSSLAGMLSDLPAPFAKAADARVPLRFEQTIQGDQGDISVQCGDLLDAQVTRYKEGGQWKVRRGVVEFGKHRKWPVRDGLWVTGEIRHLSLVGWGPMFSMLGGGQAGESSPGIAGMDLRIDRVTGYRQSVDGLHIGARSVDGKLTARLTSRQINGEVTWEPRGDGLLTLHLFNLALVDGAHRETPGGTAPGGEEGGEGKPVASHALADHGESPDIHLVVDDFSYQGKALGTLELKARQHAGDWLLQHVMLKTPEGVMSGSGTWQAVSVQPRTQIRFSLNIADVGKLLARMGYRDTVRRGNGRLTGDLSWPGGPGDFDYALLDGNLALAVRDGEFLNISPEVSGLLRILSLQAFKLAAVFSRGFVFDVVSGSANISHGVLGTRDFEVDGAPAKVTMNGQVDLGHETQDLSIVILPEVRNGTTILVLLLSSPVGAAGYWFADKVLGSPIERATSAKFHVSGTWKDPVVSKEGEQKPPSGAGGK
jgi:uncharacterized protein (TIGR02099 family)